MCRLIKNHCSLSTLIYPTHLCIILFLVETSIGINTKIVKWFLELPMPLWMRLCCKKIHTYYKLAYRMASKHSNAFQYSEPHRVAIRCPSPGPKEGSQSLCSCQHQDIINSHDVVLALASKRCWITWLFECLSVVRYQSQPQRRRSRGIVLPSNDLKLNSPGLVSFTSCLSDSALPGVLFSGSIG